MVCKKSILGRDPELRIFVYGYPYAILANLSQTGTGWLREILLKNSHNITVEKWKKAVSDNELPWLQVYVPKDSKVTADYMVNAFPTKIVLSPEGKVIATVVGEDPKFYLMLDELFKAD